MGTSVSKTVTVVRFQRNSIVVQGVKEMDILRIINPMRSQRLNSFGGV